jgi:hypothetical protein
LIKWEQVSAEKIKHNSIPNKNTIGVKRNVRNSKQKQTDNISLMSEEIIKMKDKIDLLLEKVNTSTPTTNINTTHNTVNIYINSYKDPSVTHLTNQDYLRVLNRDNVKSIIPLIEKMYFSPRVPENHSIYIPHLKYQHAIVKDRDNKWKRMNKKDVVENMISIGGDKLNGWFNNMTDREESEESEESDEKIEYLSEEDIAKYEPIVDTKFQQLSNPNETKKIISEVITLILNNNEFAKKQYELETKNKVEI